LMRWAPKKALALRNPISECMTRLVTSLIPNLLKNIVHNKAEHDKLTFFEWNKIWVDDVNDKKDVVCHEHTSFAGIFYNEKNALDFYSAKQILSKIFTMLGIEVVWVKANQPLAPWYHPYKTAQ